MTPTTLIAGFILTALIAAIDMPADNPLRRQTRSGMVEGYADEATGTWAWKGIPFARPPVGRLRWQPPQDPVPWDGVRMAKDECTPCTQLEVNGGWVRFPKVMGDEDCLYLNIYRPQTLEENLPVYFWIHGGANNMGYADLYDLENLAQQANMVVVVVQYRMSVFGYFTHPALRVEASPAAASGNLGTLDQIKALAWVRDNIAAFGGNPGNVTIAGESAGGHNVMAMLISPLAEGLFHRAVMQSGGMMAQSVATTDQIAERTLTTALVMKGRAPDAAEARRLRQTMSPAQVAAFLGDLSAEELIQAHAGGPGRNLIPLGNLIEDGYVIPENLLCTLEAGRYNKVPLIAGANASESGSINTLVPPLYEGMPPYRALLDVVQGTKTLDEVLPTQEDKDLWIKARDYGSWFWRAAMVDEVVRRVRAYQDDVYVYSFDWGGEAVRPGALGFIYDAAHALEIPFFHANVDGDEPLGLPDWVYKGFTEENRPGREALSAAMVSYLAQFARTGNPNKDGTGLPGWQPWSNEAGGVKALRLNASLDHTQIRMDAQEVSMASVRRALDAEDAATRRHVMRVLAVIQPYAAYEPGRYGYNVCD